MRIDLDITGIRSVMRMLENIGENGEQVDLITEAYARKISAESAGMAPVDSGALKGSIASSPQVSADDVHIWEWGSNLPYALKNEYTHPTKRAFIRKAVWNNREKYRNAVLARLLRGS